jgi:membrane protein
VVALPKSAPDDRGAGSRAFVGERFVLRLLAHNAFETAAAMAFWFFLSLVPLLVLAGFLVGQVARSRGVDELVGPLLEVVPGTAEGLIRSELERLAGAHGTSLAPLGVVGFLWTASSGLHNLMDVCEATVSVKRRAWWMQRAIALGWVAVGLATACLLAWIIVGTRAHDAPSAASGSATAAAAPPAPSRPGPGDRSAKGPPLPGAARARTPTPAPRVGRSLRAPRTQALAAGLLLVAGLLLLAGFYRFAVEHPPGVRRRVWPGAAAAIGTWLVVSWAFGAYAVSIADYAFYYGSLAAVAVLLVWLYLTSLALVLGAEVNGELEGTR